MSENAQIVIPLDKPQQPSLTDYFKQIEIIPLETGNEVLIGRLSKLVHYQGRYYTFDRQQYIVHVFDESGKFIFKIDNRGQGPGQYITLEDMIINPFTGYIELLAAYGLIYRYDMSGKYRETLRIQSDEIKAVHSFVALDRDTYVFYGAHQPLKVIGFDASSGKVIFQAFEEQKAFNHFSDANQKPFFSCHGDVYFSRYFNAGIFRIGKDGISLAYRWDFGNLQYDSEKMKISSTMVENPEKTFREINSKCPYWMLGQGQNNRYMIACVKLKDEYVNLIYDKSMQTCTFIDRFAESVLLYPYIVTNEYVLNYCNAGELEQYVTESMCDEYNRNILEKQRSTIGGNPIIIKYTFNK
jgi:hypothetical protein